MIGTAAKAAPAMMSPKSVEFSACIFAMPSDMVRFFCAGEHDELHEIVVPRIDEREDGKRADAGLYHGKTIRLKVFSSLAPSILAASSISLGMLSANCLMRNTPNGQPTIG